MVKNWAVFELLVSKGRMNESSILPKDFPCGDPIVVPAIKLKYGSWIILISSTRSKPQINFANLKTNSKSINKKLKVNRNIDT